MQPQPPSASPPGYQQPPSGSAKKIWISVLLPLGSLLLMLSFILATEKSGDNTLTGKTIETLMGIQGLITLGSWVFFCVALNERLIGNTKVILMVFYPIIQVGVQCVMFFCGCLAIFSIM